MIFIQLFIKYIYTCINLENEGAVIPGDLNGDGDFLDFITFASNFGKSGPPLGKIEPEFVFVTVRVRVPSSALIKQLLTTDPQSGTVCAFGLFPIFSPST